MTRKEFCLEILLPTKIKMAAYDVIYIYRSNYETNNF